MPARRKIRTSLAAALLALSAVAASNCFADYLGTLKECARTEDTTTRVQCYEDLGRKVLEQENQQPLPEEFGKKSTKDKSKRAAEEYRGQVNACQQAHDKRWFFIFENGHVWKQLDRKTRYYKDCDFGVSISKDTFGYIMRIDGKDRKIRVRRHR